MKPFEDPTIRLTPSIVSGEPVKDAFGLVQFRLALWVAGVEKDHLTVVSGQAANQSLLKCRDRVAGSGAPVGEGVYDLGDPDAKRRINWAGAVGDYSRSHAAGLGPIWIGIHQTPEYPSTTFDLGLHADWNQDEGFPGTLGCTGIPTPGHTLRGLQKVVGWFTSYDIARYVVDLGFGTVPHPPIGQAQPLPKPPALTWAKLYARPGKTQAFLGGADAKALAARVDFHDGKLGIAVNGEQLDYSTIESLKLEVAYKAGK